MTPQSAAETTAVPARCGMGALPHESGVAFRVWAPHADAVAVVGAFNEWKPDAAPMTRENDAGYWYADLPAARVGHEYRYHLKTPTGEFTRIDPCARQVTNSVGNAVVHDSDFDWGEAYLPTPPWNEWVIYELHVGTFNDTRPDVDTPGTFAEVVARCDHPSGRFASPSARTLRMYSVMSIRRPSTWYSSTHMSALSRMYCRTSLRP